MPDSSSSSISARVRRPLEEPSEKSKLLSGNLCILIAAIFWGVNISATKALIPQWMTAESIVAVRLVGGAALFWSASMFVKCTSIQRQDWLKIILGGVVGLFGFIWLFVISLKYGSAIDISIIMTLPPVFVILIGVLFRRQRPALVEYIGVALSFVGAVIVIAFGSVSRGGSDKILGDVLAILSTVCYAFYLVILEKPTHTYRPVALLRWVFLFSALPALFFIPQLATQPILHTSLAMPWSEIGFILLCPTFIAYFLVQPAIKRIGSELVSLYQYLVPVFAAVSAVILKVDTLKWPQILAMLIIVAGMVLTNIGKRRRTGKVAHGG